MQIIYHGRNMNGVDVIDPSGSASYWCGKGKPSDDMPDDLANHLIESQPSNFKAIDKTKAAKTKTPNPDSADAQED